ncbi:hypothetical protein ACOMHN_057745 [Nucella lapillus]
MTLRMVLQRLKEAGAKLKKRNVGFFGNRGLRKVTRGSMETRVARWLSMYQVTPQTTTGLSPAELLFNRKVRTRLDLAQPSVEKQVVQKQWSQKLNPDGADIGNFMVGDLVYIKNFLAGPEWLAGVVMQVTGPLSYVIRLPDGRMLKRHIDHKGLTLASKETLQLTSHSQ